MTKIPNNRFFSFFKCFGEARFTPDPPDPSAKIESLITSRDESKAKMRNMHIKQHVIDSLNDSVEMLLENSLNLER